MDAQVDGILSTQIVIDSGEYLALMFNQARYSNLFLRLTRMLLCFGRSGNMANGSYLNYLLTPLVHVISMGHFLSSNHES